MTAPALAPPRRSRRHAALLVLAWWSAAGALTGALWAALAPPIGTVVALTRAGDRIRGYVGDEADHLFLGATLMIGLLAAVAVIATVALWQWRAHRGPWLAAALFAASVLGAALACAVGAVLARWRWGVIDVAAVPLSPEHRFAYAQRAPAVFFGHGALVVALTLVVPAGTAAIGLALFALSTPRDDLGAWPPAGVSGRTPTADGVPLDGPSPPSH